MSQTTVATAMDQWQKGQVATSHYVRDISRKSADTDEIGYGELVVWGYDPETEIRQPRETAFSENTLSYAIVSGVVTVTSAGHGLEAGEKVVVTNDTYTPGAGAVLDGTYQIVSIPTVDTFTFATAEADRTGNTLDADVAAFVIKDVAGIVVYPVSGGRAKAFQGGDLTISLGDMVTILQAGDVAIELVATVSANADAFYDPSAKGFRGDSTGSSVQVPGKIMQAGVSGDIVLMRFNTDAILGS